MLGLAAGALGHVAWRNDAALVAFNGMLVADGYALFLDFIFLLAGALTILLALNYLPRVVDRIESQEAGGEPPIVFPHRNNFV